MTPVTQKLDTMPEKVLPVTTPFLPPFEEYCREIQGIWENHWLTNQGPKHQKFEMAIKQYLGASHATLFVNGTVALEAAIRALRLRGEVITTPFTFAATAHALALNGIKPVFCDIETTTFNMDPASIEPLITEETTAILPVHVFGYPCDTQAIESIAKRYNLKVLYDAAHAFGVRVKGRGIGTFGNATMFSLHATKVFHAIEGGIATCNDEETAKLLNLQRNFGIVGEDSVEEIGTNGKMNEFQAAMGLVNLRYLDKVIAYRKNIVSIYRKFLSGITGLYFLNDIEDVEHNYAYFPVLVMDDFGATRDELYARMRKRGVNPRKYFYPLVSGFQCYAGQSKHVDLPRARFVSERVLCLPLAPNMTEEDVYRVVTSMFA